MAGLCKWFHQSEGVADCPLPFLRSTFQNARLAHPLSTKKGQSHGVPHKLRGFSRKLSTLVPGLDDRPTVNYCMVASRVTPTIFKMSNLVKC